MAKKISETNAFRRGLKKCVKYPKWNQKKFEEVIRMLVNGEPLPTNLAAHKMAKSSPKNLQGAYDLHLSPDIVLVYKLEPDELTLLNVGKHNDIGMTEEVKIS